jgi:catalase
MTAATALAQEVVAPDEAAVTKQFIAFLQSATLRRHPSGLRRRFNQGRATACVEAEFTVAEGLPAEHRVGLFAEPRTYRAVIRFANASSATDRERDTRGMALRVFDVRGTNLTPGTDVQDFVLNSHPVMMVPGSREFLELLQANEAGGFRRGLYFLTHPKALRIATASRANPSSHLDISYWSTVPYLFGPGRAVKYIAQPSVATHTGPPSNPADDYLLQAIRTRLADEQVTFDFMVQFQTDAKRMPIEDASVEWKEEDSPYVPVARVRIPRQSVDNVARAAECEAASFNPWHCLEPHRPLGNMNRARREIYQAMSAFRAAAAHA